MSQRVVPPPPLRSAGKDAESGNVGQIKDTPPVRPLVPSTALMRPDSTDEPPATITTDNPTPHGVAARFATLPPYLPRNVHRFEDGGLALENIVSGHLIAIDGRWWDVLGCTSVNGWVSVDTAGPKLTAHERTPVHLAWREPVGEPVAARK